MYIQIDTNTCMRAIIDAINAIHIPIQYLPRLNQLSSLANNLNSVEVDNQQADASWSFYASMRPSKHPRSHTPTLS